MSENYGRMNAHAIGFIMKEMVRRAIEAIRAERFVFEVHAKEGESGEIDDIFTSADRAAQEIYVKMIREAFPGYGIVAEEDHLRVEADPELGGLYFTVDPLDGTKAFKRRQSHGIGSMIALVCDGQVLAAYVGDVMTREVYGFRPESGKVHRISEYGFGEQLCIPETLELGQQHILLRERPERLSSLVRRLIAPQETGGLFHDFEIATGSIGVSTARLWKGEVGATLLKPKYDTPWDTAPVVGICRRLGFVMLEPDANQECWRQIEMTVPDKTLPRASEQLIVHRSRLPELMGWTQADSRPSVR
jgi:fructose-1,6-bisphosphatase/inositol monophosphatase family enzyme